MLLQIEFGNFREASWNYVAPSNSQVIEWVVAAWEGPDSKVSEAAITKGANLCYMGEDLDEDMKEWDDCEKNEDYDTWDWKEEVQKLSETQRRNLYVSPLAWEIDSCDESDSEISDE